MKGSILIIMVLAFAGLVAVSCGKKPKDTEMTVSEALAKRQSVRSFSAETIPEETLLKILWAANGTSRGDRRTAPSAVNAQDIELYVCKADGTYRYSAKDGGLVKVTDKDIRPSLQAQNKFIMTAPLTILLVSDQSRFGRMREGSRNRDFGLIDAGIVSENISLYCTANGLGTVCCSPRMDLDAIREALRLGDDHIPVLYHPIGYPAE